MEIAWLEDFIAVAKLRNFSKAASSRFSTQPALSRRIKALEYWYGVALFDRSTYPIFVTPAGVAFLPVAESLVAELYKSRREERAKAQNSSRSVQFAMPHSIAGNFFLRWWKAQGHGGAIKAMIVAADFDECIEMLLSGSCQFLLCYQHRVLGNDWQSLKIESTNIDKDRLVPVSKCDDRGTPLYSIGSQSKQTVPLLAYTKDSFLGRTSQLLYAKLEQTCDVKINYESALVEALKTGVTLGDGIAWLPESLISQELANGSLKVLEEEELVAPLSIMLCRPKLSEGRPSLENETIWSAVAGV